MARRPDQLGPSHPRRPHPTRRPSVAGKSLPNLERPEHVRPHQARLPHRHAPGRLNILVVCRWQRRRTVT
jgi:hypothetical protein